MHREKKVLCMRNDQGFVAEKVGNEECAGERKQHGRTQLRGKHNQERISDQADKGIL